MSGYFARLLARAQQAAPRVRPQATLAFTPFPRVDDAPELEVLAERVAPAPRDVVERVVASQAEPPLVPSAPRSERRAEAQSARASRRETGEDARSTARAESDDRPVPEPRESVEQRTPLAPIVRAPHADAPSFGPHASVRSEEQRSPRGGAEFRLLPETPGVAPMRNPAADRDVDRTAFARAIDEARAQIRRQLATERPTPSEVHVTIGRIEVTTAPSAATPKRQLPERAPATSLEQYLASRTPRNP